MKIKHESKEAFGNTALGWAIALTIGFVLFFGDPITANFMAQNPFTFLPSFKLVFAGNHKPSLRNVDEAIKRRLHMVPFDVQVAPADRDPFLSEKLKEEAPGILKWAIKGCLEWQKQMLNPPSRVLASTEEYFEEEDTIGNYFEECCKLSPYGRVRTTTLYKQYQHWCKENGLWALPKPRFLNMLKLRDLYSEKKSGEQIIMGIEMNLSEAELARNGGLYDD